VTTITFLLYLTAALAYLWYFAGRSRAVGLLATSALGAAILAHTFAIGMLTMELGHPPLVGTAGAVFAFVWLLAVAYLYVEVSSQEHAMGVFIAPLLVALQAIPTFGAEPVERPPVLDSPFFAVHVSAMLVAYAGFAIAAVVSITYLLLFKEIKAKHLGLFYARLPSLQKLDHMNALAVGAGWIFLTIGVVVGGVWLVTAHDALPQDPRVRAMASFDPKILIACVSWVIYTFQLVARRTLGWSGRRAAWLSAAGFALVLVNFLPIGFYLTEGHRFD